MPLRNTKNQPRPSAYTTIDNHQDKYVLGRYENVGSNIIEITEDKLKWILLEYRSGLVLILGWLTPVSIIVSAVATLSTTTFHTALGIAGEVWEAIFIVFIIGSLVWTVIIIGCLFKKKNLLTIKQLISKIKTIDESK